MAFPSLRVSHDQLQTPIYTFEDPTSTGHVELIGTTHLGTPEYYRNITTRIDDWELNGAEVHYELVDRAPTGDLDDSTLEQLRTFNAVNILGHYTVANGLVRQVDALRLPSRWQNHDINEHELIDFIGKDFLGREALKGTTMMNAMEGMSQDQIKLAMDGLWRIMPMILKINSRSATSPMAKLDIHRNEVALEAVSARRKEDPDQDIVMLWGGVHVHGIGQALKEQLGLKHISTMWLDAMPLTSRRELLSKRSTLKAAAKHIINNH